MEVQELLDQKGNLFDHVLYEFEMYIYTYYKISDNTVARKSDQATYNALLESHAIHLRNLIEFFNCEKDCISMKTLFEKVVDTSFDDNQYQAKKIVNKAISHLTKERYTWNKTANDLTVHYSNLINPMFVSVLLPRIAYCVNLLIAEKKTKKEYIDMCRKTRIQERLHKLKSVCDKQCEGVL